MRDANAEKGNIRSDKTSTEKIAEFIASVKYDDIPESAILVAKNALLDWLGVSIAGSQETGARLLSGYARKAEARAEASVISQGFRTTAELAALANGNIGHCIDFDDTGPDNLHFNMHPSAVVMPAVLAVAEKYHKSGRQMLAAYVVGMEVMYRVGTAIGAANSKNGWHPTPVIGTISTVSACANLIGLNPTQVRYALGIAASLAGGLRNNFGSMTKPLHAGNAARNGVFAAELAAGDFTGNNNILDGEYSFCHLFSGNPSAGLHGQEDDLGKEWRLVTQGIGFKYYPSCRSTHTSIDATIYLRNKFNVNAAQIAGIICKINPHHLNMARFIKPETGYQAKFSIPYCIATALRNGKVILADFTDEKIKDPETQEIISKVKFVPDGGTAGDVVELGAEITFLLTNGQKYSHRVSSPTGEPGNPITREELASKFESCSSLILNQEDIRYLIKMIYSLDEMEDLTPVFDIIGKNP